MPESATFHTEATLAALLLALLTLALLPFERRRVLLLLPPPRLRRELAANLWWRGLPWRRKHPSASARAAITAASAAAILVSHLLFERCGVFLLLPPPEVLRRVARRRALLPSPAMTAAPKTGGARGSPARAADVPEAAPRARPRIPAAAAAEGLLRRAHRRRHPHPRRPTHVARGHRDVGRAGARRSVPPMPPRTPAADAAARPPHPPCREHRRRRRRHPPRCRRRPRLGQVGSRDSSGRAAAVPPLAPRGLPRTAAGATACLSERCAQVVPDPPTRPPVLRQTTPPLPRSHLVIQRRSVLLLLPSLAF